ncbi:acyl carrier protein [Vibrio sp. Isolate31]|uniref:acyl carrier protein n=1 Tax=unclassified Vibrio TaxID=2614977 RepID=UPI001EFC31C4|nr:MULTISPECIES: acyl carrier protein [unclassified Vibrio]MCG9553541.1 acyl carrier protein [Vibrio sp. Isolate32]MCG9603273.1 acyl carrier protein [Vibrio sp. Isolate31]
MINMLKEIVVDIAELDSVNEVSDSSLLFDDLGLDSILTMDLIVSIEQKTGVSIREEDIIEVETFSDLHNLVRKEKNGN